MNRAWPLAAGAVGVVLLPFALGRLVPEARSTARSEAFPTPLERLWPVVLAEFHRRNDGAYAIAENDPPHRLRTTVVDLSLPFGGDWTYELEPAGAGTRLTIVERSSIPNPLIRFVARYVLPRERALDGFLSDVRRAWLASSEV